MKEMCRRFQWFELLAYRIPEPSITVDSIKVVSFRKDKKGQMSLPKHPVAFLTTGFICLETNYLERK
jgi:hypothetical protein